MSKFETFTTKKAATIRLLEDDLDYVYFPIRKDNGKPIKLKCKSPKHTFGYGCPFCELYLNQYPEDRGEGGIE